MLTVDEINLVKSACSYVARRSSADVEELTQNVCLKLISMRADGRKLPEESSRWASYVMLAARTIAIDMARRNSRIVAHEVTESDYLAATGGKCFSDVNAWTDEHESGMRVGEYGLNGFGGNPEAAAVEARDMLNELRARSRPNDLHVLDAMGTLVEGGAPPHRVDVAAVAQSTFVRVTRAVQRARRVLASTTFAGT